MTKIFDRESKFWFWK